MPPAPKPLKVKKAPRQPAWCYSPAEVHCLSTDVERFRSLGFDYPTNCDEEEFALYDMAAYGIIRLRNPKCKHGSLYGLPSDAPFLAVSLGNHVYDPIIRVCDGQGKYLDHRCFHDGSLALRLTGAGNIAEGDLEEARDFIKLRNTVATLLRERAATTASPPEPV